ncbi:MAG: hypothetical protein HY720_26565 [Planctomycetes bacterium]|nr:hypothetical protein [Planctomycetota bacterium]
MKKAPQETRRRPSKPRRRERTAYPGYKKASYDASEDRVYAWINRLLDEDPEYDNHFRLLAADALQHLVDLIRRRSSEDRIVGFRVQKSAVSRRSKK